MEVVCKQKCPCIVDPASYSRNGGCPVHYQSKDIQWLRDTQDKGVFITVSFDGVPDEKTDWIGVLLHQINELENQIKRLRNDK